MAANETYKRRAANHECTYCGCKLPDNYTFRKCEKCRKDWSEIAQYARKTAEKKRSMHSLQGKRGTPGKKNLYDMCR